MIFAMNAGAKAGLRTVASRIAAAALIPRKNTEFDHALYAIRKDRCDHAQLYRNSLLAASPKGTK